MKKVLIIVFTLAIGAIFAQPKFSSINSMPGAFSRMGFGARGMGMGNAMSAVTEGNLVSYYNPAVIIYQKDNLVQTSYSFLSLDRSLNFLNFTRKFDFHSSKDASQKSSAGISAGIINSGVGKIDERDGNDIKTGELSTSENQFFLAIAKSFSDKLSIGVEIKFYYYKLYQGISASAFGLDIGALYKINEQFNVSFVISDINSKYKWDSAPIYGLDGISPIDNFPNLRKVGISYSNKELGLLTSIELENSNAQSNILRAGVEYNVFDKVYFRGGIDQFNLSNSDQPPKPTLGLSFIQNFGNIDLGVDYAFVIEQYSPQDRHIVGINVIF